MIARQQELKFKTHGGKRPGSGRKRVHARSRVAHLARPKHEKAHPVHITLRARPWLPSLRKQLVFTELRRAIGRTARSWFRIVHYSVQANHIHLLVEADDKLALSRGLIGTAIRLARAVNHAAARRGAVWGDRYHARTLRTPRDVRNGIVYVLQNWKKHVPSARGLDRCSSASSFTGWKASSFTGWSAHPSLGPPSNSEATEPPATWLLRIGWKRHGFIATSERPHASLVFE